MGFKIDENLVVHLDQNSSSFGDTSLERNPTWTKTHCMISPISVCSLVLRLSAKSSRKDSIGDNCPLIYALKQRDELKVTLTSLKPMVPLLHQLLDKFYQQQQLQNVGYDVIVPMPSSHNLTNILAKCLSSRFAIPIATHLFRKTTPDDVLTQLKKDRLGPNSIPHNARLKITAAIQQATINNESFSLSRVPTRFRKYVCPVALNVADVPSFKRVLLVDDLFASGRTLISAKDQLFKHIPAANIEALCLFSPHNGRVKKP